MSDPIATWKVVCILLPSKLTLLLFHEMRFCLSSQCKCPMVQYITQKQFVEVWKEKNNVILYHRKHLFVKQVMKMNIV